MCKYYVEGEDGDYFFGIIKEPSPPYCKYYNQKLLYEDTIECLCYNCEVWKYDSKGNN